MERNVAKTARGVYKQAQLLRGQMSSNSYFLCGFFVPRSPGDVLETFNFLENAEDSDEEEDEEGDLMDDISTDKHHRNKKHKTKVQYTYTHTHSSCLTSPSPCLLSFHPTLILLYLFLFLISSFLSFSSLITIFSHSLLFPRLGMRAWPRKMTLTRRRL